MKNTWHFPWSLERSGWRGHSPATAKGTAIFCGLLLLLAVLLGLGACSRGDGGAGLLAGKVPTHSAGVRDLERLTDGRVPAQGTAWNSNRTSVFSTRSAFVEYDLGEVRKIHGVAVMGDNNDRYTVFGSKDGNTYEPIFEAKSVRAAGMRWRSEQALGKEARYIKVTAGGGDPAQSVAEIVVVGAPLEVFPPPLREVSALDTALNYRNSLLVSATVVLVSLGLAYAGAPIWLVVALFGLLAYGLWVGVSAFLEGFPLGQLEVSLTRAVAAVLALGVVARETYSPKRYPSFRPLHLVVLSLAAALSIACFFNLGHPQFYDQKEGKPSVVHNYDMRVYFPVAKYFHELKYDGLYLASVATYAEEHGGLDTAEMKATELRDLRNHRMRPVREIQPEILAIKKRFSEARWAELKKDMRYFWETMGPRAYLSSMADHGGNATPVWLTIAYALFKTQPASNTVLIWAGLLDPLLLLAFAIVVFRTFGARTALVSLVVFGANDYYMFGSNWAGATLRNDWMVYLGIGACALYAKHYKTAGAFLAMSALIRAFPATCLIALGVPVIFSYFDERMQKGRFSDPVAFLKEQKWFLSTALGAVVCTASAVLLSSVVLGFDAWPLWVKKISSFTASPHVNHISLLTVVAGSEGHQAQVLSARMPLFALLTALFVGLSVWGARYREPHVAALLGILLMPVFMYPANYYNHFVFLLPLLVSEPLSAQNRFERLASGRVWILCLGMCAALYFTVKEQALDLHFYNASVILMATLFLILLSLLPRDEHGEIRGIFASPRGPEVKDLPS